MPFRVDSSSRESVRATAGRASMVKVAQDRVWARRELLARNSRMDDDTAPRLASSSTKAASLTARWLPRVDAGSKTSVIVTKAIAA